MNNEYLEQLRSFLNSRHHDIMVCTANGQGEPNVTVMGSPRLLETGEIDFDISSRSITLENIKENKSIVFMVVVPGQRARDYRGVRMYGTVTDICTEGEKFESIKNEIKENFDEEKASQLKAVVTSSIDKIRPIIDMGQGWETSI